MAKLSLGANLTLISANIDCISTAAAATDSIAGEAVLTLQCHPRPIHYNAKSGAHPKIFST